MQRTPGSIKCSCHSSRWLGTAALRVHEVEFRSADRIDTVYPLCTAARSCHVNALWQASSNRNTVAAVFARGRQSFTSFQTCCVYALSCSPGGLGLPVLGWGRALCASASLCNDLQKRLTVSKSALSFWHHQINLCDRRRCFPFSLCFIPNQYNVSQPSASFVKRIRRVLSLS